MSRYEIGDKKLPSVTEIISDSTDKSPALTYWSANCVVEWIKQNCEAYRDSFGAEYHMCEGDLDNARTNFREVSQTALDVGSEVHDAIEKYLQSGKEPKFDNEQAENGFAAFMEWADSHKLKTNHCELQVIGSNWAGMLDWLGFLDDKLTVVDFKTSRALYPEYRYQIAAYRSCVGAEACGILRLDKETGLPQYKDYSRTYERDLAVFKAMVNLYFLRHPRIAKATGVPF